MATLLGVERQDWAGVAHVLDVVERAPALRKGVAAALAWAPIDAGGRVTSALLHSGCPPGLWRIGIAASAAHRRDPGELLAFALHGNDAPLRERALRAAGELGRADLRHEIRAALDSESEAVRFAAGWAGALLGEPAAAPVLWALAAGGGPFAERAAAMAAGRSPGQAPREIAALERAAGGLRPVIAAVEALGDPARIPWLLERMAEPTIARRAAHSFATITGVDLAREDLAMAPPEGFHAGPSDDPDDDDVALDPDEDLPWPDPVAIDLWWKRHRRDHAPGTRQLLGKPITPEWLEEVLRRGSQPARATAAVELCLSQRRRVLFEVRAPAAEQRRALSR